MPERDWEERYRTGDVPWETGRPSSELARVISEEGIGTCRIFEAGCGSGINAVWLAEQGFEVTGVDISQLAIEKARQRAAAAGVKATFVVGDVLDLADGYEPFPFFFDRGCYHAVRRIDARAYVRSLQRVTAAGSMGLIIAGNAKDPHEPGQGPPVVTAEELHAELEPVFDIVRLREFRFDHEPGSGLGFLGWSCLVRRGS